MGSQVQASSSKLSSYKFNHPPIYILFFLLYISYPGLLSYFIPLLHSLLETGRHAQRRIGDK